MERHSLYKLLSRFVDVRPEETFTSILMFFYFFLITFPAYIIKPVRVSLYLEWLSSERLPYAYLLTALLIGFVVSLNSKLLHVLKRQLFISLCLVFFIVNLILFWFLFEYKWPWLSMIYWFWSDIFIATSVTQFWIIVNDIYNPRQARRLVGFFVTGGLLGGIGGSFLASRLAKIVGTTDLLLICPVMLALCLIIVNLIYRFHQPEKKEEIKESKEKQRPKVGYGKSFNLLITNRYLLLLAGIMASAIVVATLIDFQFNYVVEETYREMDSRTSFLGTFFTILNIFSSVLHILATNRILRNFGMLIALLIAPFFLIVCSGAIFLVPMMHLIYWAVLVKGGDKSLTHSLRQSVRELLYIPISPDIKYKAKVFIDMFVNKFAKGLGALLIIFFFSVLHFNIKLISLATIIFIIGWMFFIVMVNKEYVGIVKKKLEIKWQDADKFIREKIDVDMTKLVFDTLVSKKRSSVLYAMNLLDIIKKEKLSPELKKIISYKTGEVRATSMDSFLELDGEVFIPEADDVLDDESIDEQVKEIMSLDVYQELMRKHIDQIVQKEGKEDEVSRMEAAKALGMMDPNSPLTHNLRKLLRDESPEVLRYALESAGKLKKREFVPLVVQQLSNPPVSHMANKALLEYGNKILGTLKDYLGDPEEDLNIRRAIPEILAQAGSQRAADLLTLELRRESKDLESEIIEAIYKLKSENPQIHFEDRILQDEVLLVIKKCYLVLIEIHDLKDNKKRALLVPDLENNLARSLKQVFELLSLIYPQEDIIKAYQNICAGTKKTIDYSLELLDNLLKKEIKDALFPLVDDLPFDDKVKRCKRMLKTLEKN
ncbi:MAG: Npt1/Npt2 family nucleotide transporter [Candidatus Aminicenantaceae bacterium]